MPKASVLSLISLALMSMATAMLTVPADARTTLGSCKRAFDRCETRCTQTQIDVYDNIRQCKNTCFTKFGDCHAKIVGNEASPDPGRLPKPKGPGDVTAPQSNPTTPTKPKGPQQVTPRPQSNPSPKGPVLR